MDIITFAIQKGGTGKSSLSSATVGGLYRRNKKTILIDLDSQGNSSTCMGVKKAKYSLYDCISQEVPFKEAVIKTPYGDVLGGNEKLTILEEELFTSKYGSTSKYKLLKKFISEQIISEGYSHCIIDTPPNLGNLVQLALMSTKKVIVPLIASELSIEGIRQFYKVFKNIQEDNPPLEILGFLFNMTNPKTTEYKQLRKELEEIFKDKVLDFIIPTDQQLIKSQNYQNFKDKIAKPITIAFPTSRFSIAFEPLIDLILKEHSCKEIN